MSANSTEITRTSFGVIESSSTAWGASPSRPRSSPKANGILWKRIGRMRLRSRGVGDTHVDTPASCVLFSRSSSL